MALHAMLKLKLNPTPLGDFLLSARGIINILGKVAIIVTFWFAFEAGRVMSAAFKVKVAEVEFADAVEPIQKETRNPREAYNLITQRNIFGLQGGAQQSTPTMSVPSKLKLRLVGVNIGARGKFAMIQDETKKDEDVFEINQRVFDQATLIEILPESVRLDHNGKIEMLTLDADLGRSRGATGEGSIANADTDATEFTVPEEEVSNALANLPVLLSQARAVPFFKNGQSVGMRLFAITQGSLYEKVGLRNGDIVKSVNDTSVTDPAAAIKLFEQLKSERSITVVVERNQKDMELRYTIR